MTMKDRRLKGRRTTRHNKYKLEKSIVSHCKKSVRHHKAFSKKTKCRRITCLKCKRVLNSSRKQFGSGLIASRDIRRLNTHCSSCRHSCGGATKNFRGATKNFRCDFVFFSDLEGNSNVNRFKYGGDNATLNYLQELLSKHNAQTTQYIFGGDAWDFGHTRKDDAKEQLSSLYAIQKLQEIDTWHVLGNRDLNKLFIPFWLVLLKDKDQVKEKNNFAGIWDTKYTALSESPQTLQDAIDHILQKMQGVTGSINGFANYDGQMPDLPYDDTNSPALYTYIVNRLYEEKHNTQSALFLRHLMYKEGVMYKWIESGHIVLDFEWNGQQFVVSHGCLPTKEKIEYYDTLHTDGFKQYTSEIDHRMVKDAGDGRSTTMSRLQERYHCIMQYALMANNNEDFNRKASNALLAELTALSFSNNESKSPVNSSYIGDQEKITQNVIEFRKKNGIDTQKKLVVLHGHRNYSIDTALKYDIDNNTTVLYYDTSAWRRKSKFPTSLWGKRDMTSVYVDSAILEKPTSLSNYSTTYDVNKNTFGLMGQAYTRVNAYSPFAQNKTTA
jgi:hypothetical protein